MKTKLGAYENNYNVILDRSNNYKAKSCKIKRFSERIKSIIFSKWIMKLKFSFIEHGCWFLESGEPNGDVAQW